MKRRTFLQTPLYLTPMALQVPIRDRDPKPVKVRPGEDRFGQHSFKAEAAVIDCKVSAQDTNGALSVFDVVRTQKGGPPLHVHRLQDEWFYIVEGRYAFRVGDETFELSAGGSLFAPRGIPHTFAKIGDVPAKMILVYQPAGRIEDYFRAVTKFSGRPTQEEERQLFKAHDMEVVGPPLTV